MILASFVGWISLGLAIASFVVFVLTIWRKPGPAARPPGTVGAAEGAAKLAEALAKLVDSFSKAGPSISALFACFLFLALAAYMSLHTGDSSTNPKSAASPLAFTRCSVINFADGDASIPRQGAKTEISQSPEGCLSVLIEQSVKSPPVLTMIAGRVDRRELTAQAQKRIGTNFNLAYQRAVNVREHLSSLLPSGLAPAYVGRVILLAGGPEHFEAGAPGAGLAEDRRVEIFSLWPGLRIGPESER